MQPYDALTDEDKELMRQWIMAYADVEPRSIKAVLSYWNKSKKRLFKAFGNKLTISFPIHKKVESRYRQNKWKTLYLPLIAYDKYDITSYKDDPRNHEFINNLWLWLKDNFDIIGIANARNITEYTKYCYIESGKTSVDKVFSSPNKDKVLKIPGGTKIMRAIRKVLVYFDFPHIYSFEKWRDDISVVNTDKEIDAELVFSIHPLDYMTMSDNKCNWTSCMSWVDDGCYSTGTIEMMNSNLAIVAYLKSPNKFTFNGMEIPNKTWRALVFAHKDLLVVGKHYPYQSEMLSEAVLDILQEVLKKNLGWTYQYKKQPYRDMIHSYNNAYIRKDFMRMDCAHKIYTYTGVMYPDMIEDHSTQYLCCRNYVKKSLYLNLSGKATCMCCGKPIDGDCSDISYISTNVKYCDDCKEKYGCSCCGVVSQEKKYVVPVKSYSFWSDTNMRFDEVICEQCLTNEYLYDTERGNFIKKVDIDMSRKDRYKPVNHERVIELATSGAIRAI